uniref:mannose-6-phosphate isomerase n=1 Tax=Oryza punctata TaxID=4537 RepID=A0A0E0MGZ1_ORYPU
MASSTTASSQLGLALGIPGLGLLIPTDATAAAEDRDLDTEASHAVLRLTGAVQHYEWGGHRGASLVARLAGGEDDHEGGGDERPYAELWMGTHPTAPSSLAASGESLREWLGRRGPAALLGRDVAARWGGDLPFLFKVLSVARALSIQAHPDADLARALHALRPSTYRDANHKPEMAVAVTDFRALCGFVSVQELKDVLRTVPEVRELVGKEEAVKLMGAKEHDGGIGVRPYLQSAFTNLMTASKETVSQAVSKLKNRLNIESKVRTLTKKEQLVLSLEMQYPEDVGVLAAFFFNYVKLNPGEALYIGANEPHAYLSGECVECMATSDNVVRAGLTPKYRDVQTLCSMLTYKQNYPEIMRGVPVQAYVTRYIPPSEEFEVDRCLLPSGESVTMSPVPGPSIFLVMTGEGKIEADSMLDEGKAKEGDVFFVPAHTEVRILASGPGSMQLYRAGVNSRFFI